MGFVGFFFWVVFETHSLRPRFYCDYYIRIETSSFKTHWFSCYYIQLDVGEISVFHFIPRSAPSFDGFQDIKVREVIKITPTATPIASEREYGKVMKLIHTTTSTLVETWMVIGEEDRSWSLV